MKIRKYLHDVNSIPPKTRIYIYGAGSKGAELFTRLQERRSEVEVLGFVDTFAVGSRDGRPILTPAELEDAAAPGTLVVIASVYWNEIEAELRRRGIGDVCVYTGAEFFGEGYYVEAERAAELEPQLSRARQLLAAESDRRLYELLWHLRKLPPGSPDYDSTIREALAPVFRIGNHYLDFIDAASIKSVIDGGVEHGINLAAFLQRFAEGCRFYGFEPNYAPGRAPMLDRLLTRCSEQIAIVPLALWDAKAVLNFEVAGPASRVSEGACSPSAETVRVAATSIDDFVRENGIGKVDFIKLDVEGAEPRVLRGAAETLRAHRPQLAVSIYHSTADFLELPLQLNDLCPDYRFHLGHYSDVLNETVLYAIPKELGDKGR